MLDGQKKFTPPDVKNVNFENPPSYREDEIKKPLSGQSAEQILKDFDSDEEAPPPILDNEEVKNDPLFEKDPFLYIKHNQELERKRIEQGKRAKILEEENLSRIAEKELNNLEELEEKPEKINPEQTVPNQTEEQAKIEKPVEDDSEEEEGFFSRYFKKKS